MLKSAALKSAVSESLNLARAHWGVSGEFRLIVGVSGGVDSHVLLHVLLSLQESEQLQILVAHFDHGLRLESAQEAQFVSELCSRYGCRCLIKRAPEKPAGVNLEAWARGVRYQFLAQCCAEEQAGAVVTAHHQDDQAETILMRFLSGRVARDAYGIAHLRKDKKILRPLLKVTRSEIISYAKEVQLPFVEDSSNLDKRRLRNKLRLDLIPLLEAEYNPRLKSNLSVFAERFGNDEDYLWEQAAMIVEREPASGFLLDDLRCLAPAIRWRVVSCLAAKQVGPAARKLGYQKLDSVFKLLSPVRREIQLGFFVSAKLSSNGVLGFSLTTFNKDQPAQVWGSSILHIPGEVTQTYPHGKNFIIRARVLDDCCGKTLIQEVKVGGGSPYGMARALFDLDLLAPTDLIMRADLIVRARQEGDTVAVFGRGRRKLKKLLQEQKVVAQLRQSLPVVELGGVILWIPGIARSDLAPVSDDSKRCLELEYRVDTY